MEKKLVRQMKKDLQLIEDVKRMIDYSITFTRMETLDIDLGLLKKRAARAIETLEDLVKFKEEEPEQEQEYLVTITETRRQQIVITASTQEEAEDIARVQYEEEHITMDLGDLDYFVSVDFESQEA